MERVEMWSTTGFHPGTIVIQYIYKYIFYFLDKARMANYSGDNSAYATDDTILDLL